MMIRTSVDHHPLIKKETIRKSHQEKVNVNVGKKKKQVIDNPLISSFEGIDPLGVTESSSVTQKAKQEDKDNLHVIRNVTSRWNDLKNSIFQIHNSKHYYQNVSSLLQSTSPDISRMSNALEKQKSGSLTESERIKTRLQRLNLIDIDKVGSRNTKPDLFIDHVSLMKTEINDSWKMELRVKALKTAIQCSKELALTIPESFYPCKFIFVTDILSSVGQLVHERLIQISKDGSSFGLANDKLEAEETAQNWLCKASSIRELLPRIYIHTALAQCYSFLSTRDNDEVGQLLILMTRGLGDPLVSTYCRVYIVYTLMVSGYSNEDIIVTAVTDTLASINWGCKGQSIFGCKDFGSEMDKDLALSLWKPPLSFLLGCLLENQALIKLKDIFSLMEPANEYSFSKYILLDAILDTCPSSIVASHFWEICEFLENTFQNGEYPYNLVIALGIVTGDSALSKGKPVKFLNLIWTLCLELKMPSHFIKACTPWVQFAANHLKESELDKFLVNIWQRLMYLAIHNKDVYYLELLELIRILLSTLRYPEVFFLKASFQGLLNIFHLECIDDTPVCGVNKLSQGVSELRKLLEITLQYHSNAFTDEKLIGVMLRLFASLHDRINALTIDDEKRQIISLINNFIGKVDFGRHFDKQLDFYVEARGSFSGLDPVLEFLIQCVCRLQMNVYDMKRLDGTSSFQNASTSYCFITVPSLGSPLSRLKLYGFCGSIAIMNDCIGQGSACFVCSINEVLEVAKGFSDAKIDASEVISSINALISYLIVVPCVNDKEDPMYLFKGLIKALDSFSHAYLQLRLWSSVIRGLSACGGNEFPYHFKGGTANDALFESKIRKNVSQKLISKILKVMSTIIQNEADCLLSSDMTEPLSIMIVNSNLYQDTKNVTEALLQKLRKHKSITNVNYLEQLNS